MLPKKIMVGKNIANKYNILEEREFVSSNFTPNRDSCALKKNRGRCWKKYPPSFSPPVKGNLSVKARGLSARGTLRHPGFSLVPSTPSVCVCARACVPVTRFFFRPIPQHALHPPREGTFSNRWWPTAAQFFPSLAFLPFFCLVFFPQVHPLSPVPLSRQCPIHSP